MQISTPASRPHSQLCVACLWVFTQEDALKLLTRTEGLNQLRNGATLEKSARGGCVFCQALVDLRNRKSSSTSGVKYGYPWHASYKEFLNLPPPDPYNFSRHMNDSVIRFNLKFNYPLENFSNHRCWLHVSVFSNPKSIWPFSVRPTNYGIIGVSTLSGTLISTCILKLPPFRHILIRHPCLDDPAAQHCVERTPNPDMKSDHTFGMIRNWLRSCDNGHNESKACWYFKITPPRLPTRVIDVSPTENSAVIKLREGGTETGLYTALSYCWGGEQPQATNYANIQEHFNEIPLSILPQSVQDAVFVTRKLGLRYLWIDALCIIQDSQEDKDKEIARMDRVYSGAYLTIAAASARTCHDGFLEPREIPKARIRVPFLGGIISLHFDGLTNNLFKTIVLRAREPLDERAWALQERFTSPRLLLFSQAQVFWHCKAEFGKDGGWIGRDEYYSDLGLSAGRYQRSLLNPDEVDLETWKLITIDYSNRKLTDCTDKLPAISSIAAYFAEKLGDEYLAGLWRSTLWVDLCWSVWDSGTASENELYPLERSNKWRSPSWSFMSLDGVIEPSRYSDKGNYTYRPTIISCTVTPQSPNSLLGRVQHGILRIRGVLTAIHPVRTRDSFTFLARISDLAVPELSAAGMPLDYKFDYHCTKFDVMDKKRKMVLTNYGPTPWNGRFWFLPLLELGATNGLILAKLPRGQFHRVGRFNSLRPAIYLRQGDPQDIEIV